MIVFIEIRYIPNTTRIKWIHFWRWRLHVLDGFQVFMKVLQDTLNHHFPIMTNNIRFLKNRECITGCKKLLRNTATNTNRCPIIEYFRYINDSYLYNLERNMFPFYVCVFTCLWASIIALCSKENYNISAHHHTSTEFFVNYDNYMSEE